MGRDSRTADVTGEFSGRHAQTIIVERAAGISHFLDVNIVGGPNIPGTGDQAQGHGPGRTADVGAVIYNLRDLSVLDLHAREDRAGAIGQGVVSDNLVAGHEGYVAGLAAVS